MDKHELISAFKELMTELGKVPTRMQFTSSLRGGQYQLEKVFGTYSALKQAVGVEDAPLTAKEENKLLKKYKSICSRVEQIEGFKRHVLDLDEIFARAGNPPVIKLGALFDVHAKFVDRAAWRCALKFLGYYKPNALLLGGDFVDCEGLSHWEPSDLEPRRIVPEMKIARGMIAELLEIAPTVTTKIYLEGNHEDWIAKAMCEMPEMFDGLSELGIEINLKTLLALDRFGFDFFPLNDLVKIGKAHLTHGIYCGQHHAAKHLKEFMTNIYYGHVHDTQEANDVGVDGPVEAACCACLCRLDAKFLKGKKNKWAHGLRTFEIFPDGSYTTYLCRIIGGRMAFNGHIFDGNAQT